MWSKAFAFLKRSAKPFVYITSPNPFNPYLKPCAINITNPNLQVAKTNPKKTSKRTPRVKHRPAPSWLENELMTRTVFKEEKKHSKRAYFWTLMAEGDNTSLKYKSRTDINWTSSFPKEQLQHRTALAKGRQQKLYKLTATSTTFPKRTPLSKIPGHHPKFQIPSQRGNSEVNRSHSQSNWGASGYDSGN